MVVEATHLRADAQRNLERILEAARAVFAEEGLEASVADVAERAGVGTATIFRRFASKDDLVAAMLEQELETVVARARAAAQADDPAVGLAGRRYAGIVPAGLAPRGGRRLAHEPPTSQQLRDSKRSR